MAIKQRIQAPEKRRKQLGEEKAILEGELTAISFHSTGKRFLLDQAKNLSEIFPNLDDDQKRTLIKQILKRIVITDTEVKINFYYIPDLVMAQGNLEEWAKNEVSEGSLNTNKPMLLW